MRPLCEAVWLLFVDHHPHLHQSPLQLTSLIPSTSLPFPPLSSHQELIRSKGVSSRSTANPKTASAHGGVPGGKPKEDEVARRQRWKKFWARLDAARKSRAEG